MCARLLACPLCSQPGFLTLDALRAGLISVATRPLVCPVCNEVLLGIDKLTIHLFSHTINLNGSTVDSLKQINVMTSNNNALTAHNLHNTTFQNWNESKEQNTEVTEQPSNNLNTLETVGTSKNVLTIKDKVPVVNSEIHAQDQKLPVNATSHIVFLSDKGCEGERINTFQESSTGKNITLESYKNCQEIPQDTIKLNCTTQHYVGDNSKHINVSQGHTQLEHENMQTFRSWIQDQHCEQPTKNVTPTDINKLDKSISQSIELCENQQSVEDTSPLVTMNKDNKFSNFESYSNVTSACTDASLERINNEKNKKNDSPNTNTDNQNDNYTHEEILPNLKAFKALAKKEKTERCNICGFHFPDYNILLLHKQLVHMIDEKDMNVIPEHFLKNYSCHLCSKVFKMRGSLMVHMRVAHIGYNLGSFSKDGQVEVILNESGYNCPTCGKKFKKEQHVIQHLKTHEAKQWECDVCSKMFTTKYFLKKHKRLHSGEMPYKCNICNKTFTFQQSYHKHRLYHKDDKPHTCGTCGRSFKELSTLHNHERIHTGEKPFACETCGKCFRQRVSYLVHRRIHTGVMPYKCTMCGKSFRYKVSQRTHKCPMQQLGNIQQGNDLENQKTMQLADTQNVSNEMCKLQKTSTLQENQPMLQVINNEENKYILIINTQGQHLLTREADIANTEAPANKEQKLEYTKVNNESEDPKNIWDSDIPNKPGYKKVTETSTEVQSENKKSNQEDTNDFFSMVLSPLENRISSPTAEMEHLRVSSPAQKEDTLESYNNFNSGNDGIEELNIMSTNMEQNYSSNNNVINSLQTINEESLKQLLYGINEK